jgi:hypothetical protein
VILRCFVVLTWLTWRGASNAILNHSRKLPGTRDNTHLKDDLDCHGSEISCLAILTNIKSSTQQLLHVCCLTTHTATTPNTTIHPRALCLHQIRVDIKIECLPFAQENSPKRLLEIKMQDQRGPHDHWQVGMNRTRKQNTARRVFPVARGEIQDNAASKKLTGSEKRRIPLFT